MNKNEGRSLEQKEQNTVIVGAEPADAAGIARVRHETWLATYPNAEFGITEEDILAKNFQSEDQVGHWRRVIESTAGTRKIWVAKNEAGEVVAYCQGLKKEEANEIGGMYVLPAYQGKGLGSKLMKEVLNWLGDEKPIVLSVAAYTPGARALYAGFGFVETNELGESPKFKSGALMPSIKMVRPKR